MTAPSGVALAIAPRVGRPLAGAAGSRRLDRMRQKGYYFAWFAETGRARPYDERAGFHVTRRCALLRRDPAPGAPASDGQQGASRG